MARDDEKIIEIHLIDYFILLVKHRWMIARNVAITVVAVIVLSFFLPQKWVAVTTLMPPQEQSRSVLEGMLTEVGVPGLPINSAGSSSSEILVEILKSRAVGERVLRRPFVTKGDTLPLYKILKFPSIEIGLIRMKKNARFTASRQGLISVAVELGDPRLAADVANAYVEALDEINKEKSVSRAKNSRLYIESQLKETEKKLKQVMQQLAEFQQKHKAVALEEQMSAAIQQAGELKGQIIAKEVQLGIMLQTMKPENPLVVKTQMEIDELKRRYQELQFGNAEKGDTSDLTFSDMPEIGLQLAELTREAKVQETVWQLLNQQYYQAKIQEAKDTPTVQVLDRAVPPPFRSSPNRKLLVIIFGLLSMILSVFWVFVSDYLQKLESRPEEKQKIEAIASEFRSDFRKIKAKLTRK